MTNNLKPFDLEKEAVRRSSAQIWCRPEFSKKVMDPDFCSAIAEEMIAFGRRCQDEAYERAVIACLKHDGTGHLQFCCKCEDRYSTILALRSDSTAKE